MIIVRLNGGMGNQMFQYALGRALSLQHSVPLKLDTTFLLHRILFPQWLRPHFIFRNFDLDVFAIKASIASPAEIAWWNRSILFGKPMLVVDAVLRKLAIFPGWEKSFSFDKRVLEIGPNAYLSGFWQSPKYFLHIREALLQEFSPTGQLQENILQLMEDIRNTDSVCIHVRRSDIAAKSFHGAVAIDYYEQAIEYISKKDVIKKIFVFSDDISWCKENLKFKSETIFVDDQYSGPKGIGHMMLMRACKHFIIPNSTFSWWAAWLGQTEKTIVVAPKRWFPDDSLYTGDLIPKDWIRI